ncbi:MAG: tetratricopeptide repeat protein [Elusimicrobiota bacterium]
MNGLRRLAASLPLMTFFGFALAAEPSWQAQLSRAERLSGEGKNEESAAAAQRALADAQGSLGPQAPEFSRVLLRLSRLYETVGTSAQLGELEKRLSAIESKDFDIWLSLGDVERAEGKSLEAERALKEALALKPGDPDAQYDLARVYDDLGRFEEEVPLLKKRIAAGVRDYTLYSQLANVYIRLGRPAEAKETFSRARRVGSMAAEAYIEEGYFDLQTGKTDHAQKDFESAILVDPASPFGYHHMGSYLNHGRRYPEAEKYFRRALRVLEADPTTSTGHLLHTMNDLGIAVAAQGRSKEAEGIFLEALEKARGGDDSELSSAAQQGILRHLGDVYVSEGRLAEAEAAYKRRVAACKVRYKCPHSNGTALNLVVLGQFYLSQGRRTEAEAAAEQAEKACAEVPIGQGRLEALKEISLLYAKLGEESRREALYSRLVPLRRTMPFDPDLVWVETGLADMAAAQGRFSQAEDHCRQAIAVLDRNGYWKEESDVLDLLAGIYARAGNRAADETRDRAKILRARE